MGVMSLWDDHYANMLWLDSTFPIDSTDPGAARGTCSTDSGKPEEVENTQADSKVIFSDIRFGKIGTTTSGSTGGFSCGECEAHGFGADQCGCGFCGSFGGCGFTCGHDPHQAPLGPKCVNSPSPTPSPTPSPAPNPKLPPGGCCSWAGANEEDECGESTSWCKATSSNCHTCHGHWVYPDIIV